MSPSPIRQQVTFIYVEELDASEAFYRNDLGLKMTLDQGDCRILAVSDSAFIGLCTCTSPVSQDGVILTLVVDQVALWETRLRERGHAIEVPTRFNEKFNITQCFVRDPDGYLVELQTFHDQRWPRRET